MVVVARVRRARAAARARHVPVRPAPRSPRGRRCRFGVAAGVSHARGERRRCRPRWDALARARRPQPDLPRARRDRRHGGRGARADPGAGRGCPAGTRFTAFVNREAAAAKDGPWGELLPAVTVPVNARNRVQWVRGEQLLLPRLAARAGVDLRAQPREHGARVGALSPRGHRPRPDLRALPRGARGHPRAGHARACAAGGAPLRSRDRRLAQHAARPGRAARELPPSASTSSRWGSARWRAARRCPSLSCASACAWASGRSL